MDDGIELSAHGAGNHIKAFLACDERNHIKTIEKKDKDYNPILLSYVHSSTLAVEIIA